MSQTKSPERERGAIAIVGMAGRFPGANDVSQFWQNLRNGVESIAPIDDEEWGRATKMHPAFLVGPNLVRARPKIDGVDMFDADFFGFTPRAAQILDPQQRLFLECAWEALESAGYDSERFPGAIGVYAGVTPSTYLLNLLQHSTAVAKVGWLDADLSNRCDSLATRVAYKLNLKGPTFTVQSYCSTSLVAIHLASKSLLTGECDIALAGGVTITVPQEAGYVYLEGSILSPDGHTRTFDAKANGMVFGNGVGIVVLKRLADAVADGDTIWAVLLGSATNNDGSLKVGFTAPSVSGQTEVITDALRMANVDPATVTYVEAHGTATPLGDPAEVAALTKAYRRWTDKRGYCAIGSVKTNIGHLDAAAGVTGVIKTALSLTHKEIPATLNYEVPNPQIDFESSPFYVNTALKEWPANGSPRRAGVSAYGIGGTNAHAILEEPPVRPSTDPAREWQLLPLSARNASTLDRATTNLQKYFTDTPSQNVADIAYTLQIGRRVFDHRRIVVCRDGADAAAAIGDPKRFETARVDRRGALVGFMFTGQGAQYVNMGRGLYETEAVFRDAVDDCCAKLEPHLGFQLRDVIYPCEADANASAERLKQTEVTQPALFVIEYALAQLWQSRGITPVAMIGHSVGEYVAGHLAGVFSLDDALALVAIRGRLMQSMPGGAMLAVQLSEADALPLVSDDVCLAAINGPTACVLAGPVAAIERVESSLVDRSVTCRRLQTSHAFHSASMDPILAEFQQRVESVERQKPSIPFVSNLTGTWIRDDEATRPQYWAEHLRRAVRFSAGVQLLIDRQLVLLEVGPANTLASLARQHNNPNRPCSIVSSLRHPKDDHHDRQFALTAFGKLWLAGVDVSWSSLHTSARRRVPLPTHPFERRRYWVEEDDVYTQAIAIARGSSRTRLELARWFYQPSWRRFMPAELLSDPIFPAAASSWLVFVDQTGIGARVSLLLKAAGQKVVTVGRQASEGCDYTVDPRRPDDYHHVIRAMRARQSSPTHILHLWGLDDDAGELLARVDRSLDHGFYSLLFLAQALGREDLKHSIRIAIVTTHMQDVIGGELTRPEKATVNGPCKVIPQEFRNIRCVSVDAELPTNDHDAAALACRLVGETILDSDDPVFAYRGRHRWVQTVEPMPIAEGNGLPLKAGGTYLITGGQGGVGLALAEYLARDLKANLILTARSPLPPASDWPSWLANHHENEASSQKIRRIQQLEELGGKVLTVAADVADLAEMQAVVRLAHERFGSIDGVIHAAGVAGGGIIQMKQREVATKVLAPKVKGTLVLHEALKNEPLQFVVLCSSTAALIGGFGQVDYCAANAFLDAYAHRADRNSAPLTVSINWDTWKDAGMAVNTSVSGPMKAMREFSLKVGIASEEGVEAFRRVLSRGLPQLAVVTLDVTPSLVRLRRPKRKNPDAEFDDDATVVAASPAGAVETSEPPAANDLERAIRTIWAEVLGRRPGVDDNFFELGGDSMTAIQVTALMKARLGRDVTLVNLYEAPTVGLLARTLDVPKRPDEPAALEGIEQRAGTRLESMQRRRRMRTEQPMLETAS